MSRNLTGETLVEDDETVIELLTDAFSKSGYSVALAKSRDSALDLLSGSHYDLIICDLKLPPQDGRLEANVEHGLRVYSETREMAPGVPIVIFSAFGTVEVVTSLLKDGKHEDCFGNRASHPMINFFKKSESVECISFVNKISTEIRQVDALEISIGLETLVMSSKEKRVLRIFARRIGGTVAKVSLLGGGLSTARTVKLRVEDASGALAAQCIAKIGPMLGVLDERERFQKFVVPRLNPTSFTPLADTVEAGAGDFGGTFYTLAEQYDRSIFDLTALDADRAANCVGAVDSATRNWLAGAPAEQISIGEIRRRSIPDETFVTLASMVHADLGVLESALIQARRCPQHGDMHGANILVDAADKPILIDFGGVQVANAALDPVTLELSVLFHPLGRAISSDWPSIETAHAWRDLNTYLYECPIAPFVRACREWAHNSAAGDREVWATAYAYALRQLKYEDTNHDLALAIIECVVDALTTS